MGEPRRDTSGVTTRVVVLYVKQHGGDQAVAALLESAGETRSLDELLDEHGWSSYEQRIRLFRAAVEVLGDPGAVRRIGQSMLRSRIALPLVVLLRALGSPEQVLRNVAKANSRFSTNSTVQALEIGNGHAVVTGLPVSAQVASASSVVPARARRAHPPPRPAGRHHPAVPGVAVSGGRSCVHRGRVHRPGQDRHQGVTCRAGPPGTYSPPGRPRTPRCGCTTKASRKKRHPLWESD